MARARHRVKEPSDAAATLIVVLAVTFNAILSYINGNIRPLTSTHVVMAEGSLIIAAHLFAITRYRPGMTLWYMFTLLILVFAAGRMVIVGELDVKYFRDFFIIPTFVVLGLAVSEKRMFKTIYILQAVICIGALWEMMDVNSFADTLQIKRYYIDTRGFEESAFYVTGSNLFVNSLRPGERFLPFFDMHRMSSFYLEPVSLGNHVIVMTAFILAFWRKMSVPARAFMIIGTLFCTFSSDGRLAVTLSVLLIGITLVRRWIPTNFAICLLPLSAFFAIALAQIFQFQPGSDDFEGRLYHTVDLFGKLSLYDVMGLSNELLWPAADSGINYMIITQSLLGLSALWVLITLGLHEDTRERQVYKNAICLYLSLVMLVSYSFISIKTAAPLWFVYGLLVGARPAVVSAALPSMKSLTPHAAVALSQRLSSASSPKRGVSTPADV